VVEVAIVGDWEELGRSDMRSRKREGRNPLSSPAETHSICFLHAQYTDSLKAVVALRGLKLVLNGMYVGLHLNKLLNREGTTRPAEP